MGSRIRAIHSRTQATMVFFSPEVNGAMFGFGIMCYSNTVRKVRMMRAPWEHAGLMVVGAYVGHQLSLLHDSEEEKLKERLMVQRLRNEGLLPLPQGSSE